MNKKASAILIALAVIACPALGYIDPGTGGLMLTNAWTLITGFFGAVTAMVAIYFIAPIKKFIIKIMQRNGKK